MLYVRISTLTSLRRQKWSYVYPGNSMITPVLWKVANGYTWKPWMPIRYFSRPNISRTKPIKEPNRSFSVTIPAAPTSTLMPIWSKGIKNTPTQPWWHSSSSNKSWISSPKDSNWEPCSIHNVIPILKINGNIPPIIIWSMYTTKRTTSIHWNPWTKEVWHWGTILLIKR